MEKILITGGTGFVGRYIVREALKKGYETHLIIRNPSKAQKIFFDERLRLYQLNDFTNKIELLKIISHIKPDYVIHLIGIIQQIKSKGITFEKVHYEYSKTLYEVLKQIPPKKVVHMSALGVEENAPSKYHKTKLMAEKELQNTGIPYVIIRPSFILGPEQLLFAKIKPIIKKTPLFIFPEIKGYKFQPIDVRDVAESFIRAMEVGDNNIIFELCGDENVTIGEIVHDFVNSFGKKVILIPLPMFILRIFASEQYKMMWRHNICEDKKGVYPVQKLIGRKPIPYRESIRWSSFSNL